METSSYAASEVVLAADSVDKRLFQGKNNGFDKFDGDNSQIDSALEYHSECTHCAAH